MNCSRRLGKPDYRPGFCIPEGVPVTGTTGREAVQRACSSIAQASFCIYVERDLRRRPTDEGSDQFVRLAFVQTVQSRRKHAACCPSFERPTPSNDWLSRGLSVLGDAEVVNRAAFSVIRDTDRCTGPLGVRRYVRRLQYLRVHAPDGLIGKLCIFCSEPIDQLSAVHGVYAAHLLGKLNLRERPKMTRSGRLDCRHLARSPLELQQSIRK